MNFDFLKKILKITNGCKCIKNMFLIFILFFQEDINMRKIIKIHRKMSKWMKCIENIFFKNLSFLIFGKCFEKKGKKLGYEKNILFFL
jgi:hypothetical protein